MEGNESYAEAKQPSDWLDNPGECFMWNPAVGCLLAGVETDAPKGEAQWEIEACLVGQDEVSSLAAAPRTDGMTWMDVVQSGGMGCPAIPATRQNAAMWLSEPGWVKCAEQGRFDGGLTLGAAIELSKSTGSNNSNDEHVYRQEPERLPRWITGESEPEPAPDPRASFLGRPDDPGHRYDHGYYSGYFTESDGTGRGRGESPDLEL